MLTFRYCCRLRVRPACGSCRWIWAFCRSCASKPFSPASSKLLLSWAHASMSWGVYPFSWMNSPSHSSTVSGDEVGDRTLKVRMEGSRDGPDSVMFSEESWRSSDIKLKSCLLIKLVGKRSEEIKTYSDRWNSGEQACCAASASQYTTPPRCCRLYSGYALWLNK